MAIFFAKAVKLDDVGVQEPFERFDFLLEAFAKALVVGQVPRQHLDGRPLARFAMLADIHRAHAAAAEELFELVGAKAFERHTAGRYEAKISTGPL